MDESISATKVKFTSEPNSQKKNSSIPAESSDIFMNGDTTQNICAKSAKENAAAECEGEIETVPLKEVINSQESKVENKDADSKEETNEEISRTENLPVELKEETKQSQSEETMDVASEENVADVPMEVEDNRNLPRLVLEGVDDEGEETMVLTVEEAQKYILGRVKEYMKDPKVNPLLIVQNEISEFHSNIQQKNEDFNRLSKVFEVLYRDQVKFLRHIGVMSRAETKTVGVGVDLPWLPETMSNLMNNEAVKQETSNIVASVNKNSLPKKEAKKEPSGPVECIDLTDDDAPAAAKKANIGSSALPPRAAQTLSTKHPAPVPLPPENASAFAIDAPKPNLNIFEDDKGKGSSKGIVLQWDLPIALKSTRVKWFEIFGYQEKPFIPITAALWKKIGSVEPMPLPMSCTLTQFTEGFVYHFIIRSVSSNGKFGYFSEPKSILFTVSKTKN